MLVENQKKILTTVKWKDGTWFKRKALCQVLRVVSGQNRLSEGFHILCHQPASVIGWEQPIGSIAFVLYVVVDSECNIW